MNFEIGLRPSRNARTYIDGVGPLGVFARHVLALAPEAPALLAYEQAGAPHCDGRDDLGEAVIGAAMTGINVGLIEASDAWVWAAAPEIARALLARSPEISANYVLMSAKHGLTADDAPPGWATLTELLFVLDIPANLRRRGDARVTRLSVEALEKVEIPEDIQIVLGDWRNWQGIANGWGLIDRGVLTSVADTSVRDGRYAAIQNLYTVPASRGRGHAKAVIATLAESLLADGLMPVYVVAENNVASINVICEIGFSLGEILTSFAEHR